MKSVAKRPNVKAQNAWGHDAVHNQEDFQIEESDVGHVKQHYLGMDHRSLTLTRNDVGRLITVYSSPGWTCWTWASA